jgi:acyl carrier protein
MPDVISSRTPEGWPNRCPVCGGEICIEPSLPPGNGPCPQCGTLLWFFNSAEGHRRYEASLIETIHRRLAPFVGDELGIRSALTGRPPLLWKETVGDDSLDAVEFVMALNSEFGLAISPDEAAQIKTVADAVELIARRQSERRAGP